MKFRQQIKQIMQDKRYTGRHLASVIGISEVTLSRWYSYDLNLKRENVQAIEDYLDVQIEWPADEPRIIRKENQK